MISDQREERIEGEKECDKLKMNYIDNEKE